MYYIVKAWKIAMFVELVGCPACGKTHFMKLISNKYTVLDFEYNIKHKTRTSKAFFLIKNTKNLLDLSYWKLKRLIKKQKISNKAFYLRQFRLDYILRKKALKMNENCFFSENLINLSSYIFKNSILKNKFRDIEKFYSILDKNNMLSNFVIIYIESSCNNNFRAFVSRDGEKIGIDQYKTRKLNDKICMDYIVSKSKLPVYSFDNNYDMFSDQRFEMIVEHVLNF